MKSNTRYCYNTPDCPYYKEKGYVYGEYFGDSKYCPYCNEELTHVGKGDTLK